MKKIGFIDYYMSEWHANNYPKWMVEAGAALGEEIKIAYAYAEVEVSPVDGRTTDEWCAAYGAERCATVAELCEKSDYVVILAPSNPECHLRLADAALPFGKPTYIDKTFSPDGATADAIFALAEKYNVPLFSASSLRYAAELQGLTPTALAVFGGGDDLGEYIVHQLEMIVMLMGTDYTAFSIEKTEKGYDGSVTFRDGRVATLHQEPGIPFAVCADGVDIPIKSRFSALLATDVVRAFLQGDVPVPKAETLAIMHLRDAMLRKVGLL